MTERSLTAGERLLITNMFGSSINLDSIRISDQPIVPGQDVPVTPTGTTIYWPPGLSQQPNSSDFSTSSVPIQGLFLHEVTHLWQSQHGVNVSGEGIGLQFQYRVLGRNVYSLAGADPNTT